MEYTLYEFDFDKCDFDYKQLVNDLIKHNKSNHPEDNIILAQKIIGSRVGEYQKVRKVKYDNQL